MVHFSKFSLINFVALSTEKSSSLHTIILKNKTQRKQLLSSFSIEYIFLLIEIRYVISIAINPHIDCLNNHKFSVRWILKVTARSLESVSFCIFCYPWTLFICSITFWTSPAVATTAGSESHHSSYSRASPKCYEMGE